MYHLLWRPLLHWHDLAADRDIMYSYSKSKMRGAELAFNVLPCLFHTSSHCHALTPKQMHTYNHKPSHRQIDMWRYPAGTWSTWHWKHSRPIASCSSGSTFICGHCNVNSLSLSISKKDYTGLHFSWCHLLYMKNRMAKRKKRNEKLKKVKVIVECWCGFIVCDSW